MGFRLMKRGRKRTGAKRHVPRSCFTQLRGPESLEARLLLTSLSHPALVSDNPADTTPHVVLGGGSDNVYAFEQIGSTMYAGGRFDEVQDPVMTTTYSRQNFVAFDAETGVISPFNLSFNGMVTGIVASEDETALYISGAFSEVNGITRRGIAKYDLVSNQIDPTFAPTGMRTVSDIKLANGYLIAAGNFDKHLMAMDLTTGEDLGIIDITFSGVVDQTDETRVRRLAVSPDGTRLVGTGNFANVNGQPQRMVFMLHLGSPATLSSWYAPRFDVDCPANHRLPAQGVDFSPDGSYFVIVTTGAKNNNGLCDAAARFESADESHDVEPTWINWTGGDTLYSVAITGPAVYVGGHQRWLDNPQGHDSAGPGAVSRPGIGAIDPVTGQALPWNPTKSRNHGTMVLFATPDGLWVGSDGERFGQEDHVGIGFAPLDLSPTPDTTRPDTFIDSGPSGSVSSTSATFSFSASEPSTFQCRLEGSAFAPCTSPVSYENLTAGPHTFQVVAVDGSYNMDASPAEQSWTVLDPGSELIGNPGFEVDTSGWKGNASSNTLTRVSGGHSGGWAVEVSKNVAGGVCGLDDSPNWVSFTEDGSYTASIWARSDTPGITLKLRVREYMGGSRQGTVTEELALTSSWQQVMLNYIPVAPGSTLDLEAYSSNAPAGVCFQADDVSITLDVGPPPDTTPPETFIDSGPSGVLSDTSASFSFSATEPSTFECRLDGAAFAPCTSPVSYQNLTTGSHTFQVAATDLSFNMDASPAEQSWTVVVPGSELIGNPGFEADMTGWKEDASSNTLTRVAGGHSGGWAVEVSTSVAGGVCGLDDSPNWVTSTADGSYTASIWARSDTSGVTLKLRLREYVSGAKQGSVTEALALTSSWQRLTANYIPVAPGSTLDFEAYASNAPAGVCFQADDASIIFDVGPPPPVADDDAYVAAEDAVLSVTAPGVLEGDTDPENDPLTAVLITQASSGVVVLNPDGSFTYTPNSDFHGTDSFTYRAQDGTSNSNLATVTLTVTPVNDAPVATGQTVKVTTNTPKVITLSGSDIDGDPLSFSVLSDPTSGILSGTAPNLTYTPDPGFTGADSFTFLANDGTVNSATGTITINVADNNAPIADPQSVTVNEDSLVAILLTGSDADSDPITFQVVESPLNGTLTGTAPDVTYTPNAEFNGLDSFTFKVNDGQVDSAVVTVSIDVSAVNDAPMSTADSYSLDQDTTLSVVAPGVLGNDSDIDGDSVTASLVTTTGNGSLTLGSDGSFDYTPNPGFVGSDSFSYQAHDGTIGGNTVAVSLIVNAVPGVETLIAANFDVDGNGFGYVDDSFRGTAAPAYATGLHLPSGGFSGGGLRVTLGGVDTTTVLGMSGGWQQSFTLNVPAEVTFRLRYNLTQAANYESDEFSQALVRIDGVLFGNGTNDYLAQLVGDGNGGSPQSTGWQSFELTTGTLTAGTHSIIIGAYNNKKTYDDETTELLIDDVELSADFSNDAPVATADSYSLDQDTTLSVVAPGVLGNDSDSEGDSMTALLVTTTGNGSLTLGSDGSFDYTPNPGFVGSDSFSYRAHDGAIGGNTVTVSLTVNAVPVVETLIAADFDADESGFGYVDDSFRGTAAPAYATGLHLPSGGFSGGGLRVTLGGVDTTTVLGMSGGWQQSFTLNVPAEVTFRLRYNLTQAANYESDEFSQALVRIDGVLYGNGTNDYLAQLVGDGNGGSPQSTGWQSFELTTGTLSAGTHSITIGAFNNKKTYDDETTELLIDDVEVSAESSAALTLTTATVRSTVSGSSTAVPIDTGSPLDANGDGYVSAIDALVIINYLSHRDAMETESETAGQDYDTNGDGWVSAIDALLVINYLNRSNAAISPSLHGEPIDGSQLAPIVDEAIDRLSASRPNVTSILAGVTFEIVDLQGNMLGRTFGNTVQLDVDAAGFGWFVDTTPHDDTEFTDETPTRQLLAAAGSPASERVDLLTVVMHELGHVLGFEHTDLEELMGAQLPFGTRRAPDRAFEEALGLMMESDEGQGPRSLILELQLDDLIE